MVARLRERHDCGVVRKDVRFIEAELEVEYVKELALYPANVTLSENTGAESPVDILESGVIGVLERSESANVSKG